jgi:hypothetical protein
MIDPRKLAAIDIALLGPAFIIAEFAAGVLLSVALGVFILLRGGSLWQIALAVYFLSLGLNYVPMLVYAVDIARRRSALAEIGDELTDKRQAMAKYRRQSVFLLVPLVVPAAALRNSLKRRRPAA